MDSTDFIIKIIIPAAIVAVSLLIYLFRKELAEKLLKHSTPQTRPAMQQVLSCFKVDFSDPKKFIFEPMVIAIIVTGLIFGELQPTPLVPWIYLLASVTINPTAEEIMVRGALFGVVFLVAIPYLARFKLNIDFKKVPDWYTVTAWFLQAALFAAIHQEANTPRLIAGLLTGWLYLKHDRNLVPPIAAHAAWNAVVYLLAMR